MVLRLEGDGMGVGMAGQARYHDQVLREHLARARTVIVGGPRQVGKTAVCSAVSPKFLDWNNLAGRLVILKGPEAIIKHLGLERSREREATIVIDNLHGHRNWKGLLRSFSSRYGARLRLVVTTLEVPRGPGNGLPGSSHVLRIHPWSVGECARTVPPDSPVKAPAAISDADWAALLEHGGFPEPFAKRDPRFTRRWHAKRRHELLESDLLRFASVRDPAIVQMLALLLAERSATHLVYSDLSRELDVTVDTIRRWMDLLVGLQYGFCVRPWFSRVPKALRKEPKWFLRDWSSVTDPSGRGRTFVACHLLKAVEGWTDLGFGQFELRYVRDKSKREVDFLVLRDRRPWFLVAVANDEALSPALRHFQDCTRARHAFQVVLDGAFSATDCFERTEPVAVSARTLLSQLL
jgi:predicted AAA+ superfamily ATPase